MNEIKLKPCPFCGGKAEKIEKHDDLTFKTLIYIRCTDCRATTHIFDKFSEWFDEEYLIECWNSRTETLKHGEWELESTFEYENGHSEHTFKCSRCNVASDTFTNYCSNCGAKMKEENND